MTATTRRHDPVGAKPRRRATAALAGLVVAAGLLLGACTSPRNALGTPASRCFKVLPAARLAVHGKGHFTGVRYVTTADLVRSLHALHPALLGLPSGVAPLRTEVCLVAYTGHFAASTVVRDWPARTRSGRLALVVVRARDGRVLATIVLAKLPLRFSHLSPLER